MYAAALANGGSFDDIQPGIDFFAELSRNGNFIPVESTPATIEKGETPISIDWDFLNLGYGDEFRRKGADVDWRTAIPFDGSFAEYYANGVNKDAPHPAAARLWQEYVFSPEGQNIRLGAYARPVLMDAMKEDGTLDTAAAENLPTVEGTPAVPDGGAAAEGEGDRQPQLGQGRHGLTTGTAHRSRPSAGRDRRTRSPVCRHR